MLHKSMAIVSDEPSHNALTIFAILQKTMPYVKSNVEDLDQVHYWTDSPTSQYRNKTICSIVRHHEEHFKAKLLGIILKPDMTKGHGMALLVPQSYLQMRQ